MRASDLQRLLKQLVLCFVLVQALALVLLGALWGRRGVRSETSSIFRRRLQQWQAAPCSSGYHYCWTWQPAPGQPYPDDDAAWNHYDDLYHDLNADDDGAHHGGNDDDVEYHDDYYYDDKNWYDDYYHTATDDDYVYKYEAVPDANIIHTPNGGYGGRRGRSLSQIRFNKCPPVIDGYESSKWRYEESKFSKTKRRLKS